MKYHCGIIVVYTRQQQAVDLALEVLAMAGHKHCILACAPSVRQLAEQKAQTAAALGLECVVAVSGAEGYSAAANAGAAACDAIYSHLAFLSADSVPFTLWPNALCGEGAAFPATNAPGVGSVPCEEAVRKNRFSLRKLAAFAQKREVNEHNSVKTERFTDGLVLPAALFRGCGGFAESLTLPQLAWDELALRLQSGGVSLACVRSVYLHHWVDDAFSQIDPYWQAQEVKANRNAYAALTGAEWQQRPGDTLRSLALETAEPVLAAALRAQAQQMDSLWVRADTPPRALELGQYPEVPAGELVRQLKGKTLRRLKSIGPVANHIRARNLANPAGFAELLDAVQKKKAAGIGCVAILAPYFADSRMSPQDGYIRRVKAVDEDVLDKQYKIYCYEHWVHQPEFLQVQILDDSHAYVQYDSRVPEQRRQVLQLIEACGVCYSHSVLRLLPAHDTCDTASRLPLFDLPGVKYVWDVHGAVPEEFALDGKQAEAEAAAQAEALFAAGADVIVTVNRATQQHLLKKYPGIKARFVNMPIFNEDLAARGEISAVRPQVNGKPLAVYAGGLQAWQKIPLMQQCMAAADAHLAYKIYTPEPDAFAQLWQGNPFTDLELDTKTPQQLMEEYTQCSYGFVLRDDIAVNNVACPTKLIEYLQYGIVPVLHTEKIGDFAALGMQYLTDESLLNGNYPSEEERIAMAESNLQVLHKLKADAVSGRESLRALMCGGL
ncbi:MAG: hypothetical protein IJ347_07815 [Faecalibacterium sp.]|nr:hypothetical protein [Faecalibacterium sp.]